MNADSTVKCSIEQYMETFSERELRGYAIAKSHFGKSIQIEKSNGYQKWLKECITTQSPSQKSTISGIIPSSVAVEK